MVIPPQPSINPPGSPVYPGDITRGLRLDTIDLHAILAGGYPGELLTATAASTATLLAVPDGVHRCIQLCSYFTDNIGDILVLEIIRNGQTFQIHAADWDIGAATGAIVPSGSIKGFMLKSGDVLQANDIGAAGSNVTISIMYVDVVI